MRETRTNKERNLKEGKKENVVEPHKELTNERQRTEICFDQLEAPRKIKKIRWISSPTGALVAASFAPVRARRL